MAKKRNLEGTMKPRTLFSELPQSSLHSISEKMGINMKGDSNTYFDILKELEIARSNLFIKQQQINSSMSIEEVVYEPEEPNLQLEWI